MTDRAEEIEELQIKTQKFYSYLSNLIAERNRLEGGTVTGDLIKITQRLARINVELEVGDALFKKAKSALSELKRRDRFYKRVEAKKARRNQGT